jgi:hypothetical protein
MLPNNNNKTYVFARQMQVIVKDRENDSKMPDWEISMRLRLVACEDTISVLEDRNRKNKKGVILRYKIGINSEGEMTGLYKPRHC